MSRVFPFSFKGKNIKSVILSTLIYTLLFIAFATVAFFTWLLDLPDAVNTVVNIVRQFSLLYCICGIVVAILYASDVIVDKE